MDCAHAARGQPAPDKFADAGTGEVKDIRFSDFETNDRIPEFAKTFSDSARPCVQIEKNLAPVFFAFLGFILKLSFKEFDNLGVR